MECQNFIESGVKLASRAFLPLFVDVVNNCCVRCQRLEVCPVLSVDQVSMLLSPDYNVPVNEAAIIAKYSMSKGHAP